MVNRLIWIAIICWIGAGIELLIGHFPRHLPFEPAEVPRMLKYSGLIIFLFGSIVFIAGIVKMKRIS